MTQEELFDILRERWEKVDQRDRGSLRAYNEFAREMRRIYFASNEWKENGNGKSSDHHD